MIKVEELTEIGSFRKTHALRGEMNAVFDFEPTLLNPDDCLIIELDGIFVPFFIESVRPKGSAGALVKLSGVDSEEDARRFVNHTAYMLTSSLPEGIYEDDEDGGYATDFIGYEVFDPDSGLRGTISDVDLSTENALFIVNSESGDVMIPVADELVREIDEENKKLILSLPEGLIDLN